MSRGSQNQPEHADLAGDCQIVLYAQDAHQDVSGTRGVDRWQSHHIVCLAATGRPEFKQKLENCLYLTVWNINESPNMIGLPVKAWYKGIFAQDMDSNETLPCHNVDHNTSDGYLDEVRKHLQNDVWSKFDDAEPDHGKNPESLAASLDAAARKFKAILKARGRRNGGPDKSWDCRFDGDNQDSDARIALFGGKSPSNIPAAPLPGTTDPMLWFYPFSMADNPTPRSPGVDSKKMTNVFNRRFWI